MTESSTDGPIGAATEESPPLVPIGFALGLAFGFGLFLASGGIVISLAVAALLGGAFALVLLLLVG